MLNVLFLTKKACRKNDKPFIIYSPPLGYTAMRLTICLNLSFATTKS